MARALTALTIGPLDSSGRDGVLADLKAFSALGLHGCAVATEVNGTPLDIDAVQAQLDGLLTTMRIDAVKLACPAGVAAIDAVASVLSSHDVQTLVLDPDGAALDAGEAAEALKARLLPLALVATPDIAEAEALSGMHVESWEDMREAARAIAGMGAANVVIKGSARGGDLVTDLLFDGKDFRDYTAERVQLTDLAGAGTTFEAAIAAALAKGETVQHSVAAAKAYVTKALQSTYELGGSPALHHFYRYWRASAQ